MRAKLAARRPPTRCLKATTLACSCLAMSACGHRGTQVSYGADGRETVSIANTQAGDITAEMGEGVKPPADMPAWAPPYPGSKVLMAQLQTRGMEGHPMKNVMLTTPDPVQRVTAFYDSKIALAGIKPMQAIGDGEGAMRVMQTRSGMGTVGVTKNDEGGSSVSITYQPAP